MPGGSDDRASGMTSSAAGVETRDGGGIGHALIKAEGVIDMVNMSIGDAEVLFDFWGREGEDIHHAGAEIGCELIGDAEEMLHVALLFPLPGCSFELIGDPLYEEGGVVPSLLVLQGGIRLGVDVPLDSGEVSEFTRLYLFESAADVGD